MVLYLCNNKIYNMKKICEQCKTCFNSKSNAQKICENCKYHKCEECKIVFYVAKLRNKKYKAKFCSKECYLKSRFNTKECKFCGKESEYSYCSDECRKKYWNKNSYKIHSKKWYWKNKLEVIDKLGGKCVKCNENDFRLLDIDHIQKEKKKLFKNHQYTNSRRMKEWKENMNNLRLLCVKCHRLRTWKQQNYGDIDIINKRIAETKSKPKLL